MFRPLNRVVLFPLANLVLQWADDGEEALGGDGHHGQDGGSDGHVAKGPEKMEGQINLIGLNKDYNAVYY